MQEEQKAQISTDGENWKEIVCQAFDKLEATKRLIKFVRRENGKAIFENDKGELIETDDAEWLEPGQSYEYKYGQQ